MVESGWKEKLGEGGLKEEKKAVLIFPDSQSFLNISLLPAV